MTRHPRRGFTLIEFLAVVAIIGLLIALILPAVQSAREAARRGTCKNNLRQIGLALANYVSSYRVYPFGVGADGDDEEPSYTSPDNRRYALHTQILPYLDQAAVYHQIDFRVQPFYPDTTGDPAVVTGQGPNEAAAQVRIQTFLCPSDGDRLSRPWGPNNYRSCNGSSWDGRRGNGLFGQITSVRPGHVRDGLSNTAAFSERVRGDDDRNQIDLSSDLFGTAGGWTEDDFRNWCANLTEAQAATIGVQDANSGMTWLEGNMTWTRYNHVLPPGHNSCKAEITWKGVAMTATSRHRGGVHVLLGDGAVRFVAEEIDAGTWRALGTISGGERAAAF